MNRYPRYSIALIAVWSVLAFHAGMASAHSPHDIIQSLAVATGDGQRQDLFVIVQRELRKSTDGGTTWKQVSSGLDYNHLLQRIVASPSYHADQTLFLSTKGSGIYRSTDRGASWTKVNHGLEQLRIGLMAVSPHHDTDRTVLAAGLSGGLYKSDNRGETWRRIRDPKVVITAIHFAPGPEANEIVIGDHQGRVYRLTDGGETWRLEAHVKDSGGITALLVPPASERVVLCGTQTRGMVAISDHGATVADASQGILDIYINSLALSPAYASDATIYAVTWFDGVYRTTDNGRTWHKMSRGLTADPQAQMIKAPRFTALHPSPDFARDRTLYLAGFDGLFKSTDAAATWTALEADALGRLEGIALSPQYHTDRTLAFSTYRLGAFLSADGGQTWRVGNKGLATRLADIAFSPAYPSDHTIFAASTDFFYKSTARATTWDRIDLPARDWKSMIQGAKKRLFKTEADPSRAVPPVRVAAPSAPERPLHTAGMWDMSGVANMLRRGWRGLEHHVTLFKHLVTKPWTVRARDILVSPHFATDQTVYVSTANNRLFRSVDGGQSWSVIWRKSKKQLVAVALSPHFATDRTLFLSTSADGVHKSVDGGETWQALRSGPKRGTKGLRIAISPAYPDDQTLWISNAEGLLSSHDGGQTWTLRDYPHRRDGSPIAALAISPTYAQNGHLLLSVQGRGLFQYDRAQDAFTPTGTHLIEEQYVLNDIVYSPTFALDNTVYGASQDALLRSTNGGETWQLVATPAYPKKAPSQETAAVQKP